MTFGAQLCPVIEARKNFREAAPISSPKGGMQAPASFPAKILAVVADILFHPDPCPSRRETRSNSLAAVYHRVLCKRRLKPDERSPFAQGDLIIRAEGGRTF